jgi:hypothetical protein
MTPREFVQDLLRLSQAERLGQIDGWLEAEAGSDPQWGAGGTAFVTKARAMASGSDKQFRAWVDGLKPCLSGPDRVEAIRSDIAAEIAMRVAAMQKIIAPSVGSP